MNELEPDHRKRLPSERRGTTAKFTIIAKEDDEVKEIKGYVTANTDALGHLMEIFIKVGKSGAVSAIYEQWAIAASIALQNGVPVEKFFRKFVGTQFQPSGLTKNKEFPTCTSVLDLVSRWVLARYGAK